MYFFSEILCFPLQKCRKNSIVGSKPNISSRFSEHKNHLIQKNEMGNFEEKNCMIFIHFQTNWATNETCPRKFFILDASEHVFGIISQIGIASIKFRFPRLIMFDFMWNP